MTIWIERLDGDARIGDGDGPLAGATVGVKDNVDVAGVPTTAGCPSYAFVPDAHATAVARLIDAGAVVAGKTNLDQFATGLVGTRSPYGAVDNPVAPGLVSGGSSSGSAAAVAAGEVDLGVGTDTAGSGRVPAAFCGIVGLKPTRGWVPNRGVVPACASFDCTTIFARTLAEAVPPLEAMTGPDALDPSSRIRPDEPPRPVRRIGIPGPAVLEVCDARTRRSFADAVGRCRDVGFRVNTVDLAAYLDAGALLYGSALVAERAAAVGAFLATEPPDADPTVAGIIAGAGRYSATDLATALARLDSLRVRAAVWDRVDAVLLPTAPFHPSIDDVAADPVGVNGRLGTFVSGCNLVDWCAAAIPQPPADGPPFGVQLLGPAWSDRALWSAAARLLDEPDPVASPDTRLRIGVLGAHLDGQPLNHQLRDRGATLVTITKTAPVYRMVALDSRIPKPGLIRVAEGGGAVEVEVWALDAAWFGNFVDEIPAPLSIGTLELADGSTVSGFLCEPHAADGATDITEFGGWRAWLASR